MDGYTFPHRKFGIGAIVGDIVGSPFEFDRGNKSEDFSMFSSSSYATDDTIMTLAVAEGLVLAHGQSMDAVRDSVIKCMTSWGEQYPDAGYGARFSGWLYNPKPYGSFGNGSAMRVSSVGWLYNSLEDVMGFAKLTAEVSHNHPEGIKGAQATAAAIYLARTGVAKSDIKKHIETTFRYDLSRTLDDIRPKYSHVETCQETVPEAITAYLEGNSFEDVVRKAVSLGGDCDTLTAIAASIAEASYPVPDWIREEAFKRLDVPMKECIKKLEYFWDNL